MGEQVKKEKSKQQITAEGRAVKRHKQARVIAKHAAEIAMGFIDWGDWPEHTVYASACDDARISPEIRLGNYRDSDRRMIGKVFVAYNETTKTIEDKDGYTEPVTVPGEITAVGVHVYSTDQSGEDRRYEISNMWNGSDRGRPQDAQDALNTLRQIALLENPGTVAMRPASESLNPRSEYL